MTRHALALAVLAVLAPVLAATGCTPSPKGDPPAVPRADALDVRDVIYAELMRVGHSVKADLVKRRGAGRLTRIPASFLRNWQIVRLDYPEPSHPVVFYMAVGNSQARLLTENPAGFNEVTAADSTRVGDDRTAVDLARTYVETTRPMVARVYVVDRVEAIRFLPEPDKAEKRRRDQIVERYRDVVAPPRVTRGQGFTATVYVVRERELQQRTLTISPAGAVRDSSKVLVDDLPVPYTT